MWLRIWDKTKEKNGCNTAIYELHTSVRENFATMHFLKEIVQRLLNNIDANRFVVILNKDSEDIEDNED